jgi:RNA polymerase-associated protein CTR9
MYQQARESRDVTPDGLKKRRRDFERAVELYEKALSLDSMCAIAAQGLAIATAEDALGNFGQGEDQRQRLSDAREAIDIFAKVRETIADGSVYSNMGHCYYTRDEFDRAIESVCFAHHFSTWAC